MKRSTLLAFIIIAIPMGMIYGLQQAVIADTTTQNVRSDAGSERTVIIGLKSRHSAIDLAGKELAKYLGMMAGDPGAAAVAGDPTTVTFTAGADEKQVQLELGLLSDFGLVVDGVDDPTMDDAIYIDVRDTKGVIAGSNPRSVLFAVYRFLEASGCRWIRPGHGGDYVPSRRIDNLSVRLSDKAMYRFRGDSPDGAYSLDHVLEKIEWSSKVGLNTYYAEFFIPRYNYNDYYSRKNYPSLKNPEQRTDSEIIAYHGLAKREAKRRGMLIHAVGHGWTGKFFGNPEIECDHRGTLTVPEDQKKYLALVGGERVMRGPTTTDLCYGNPEVQRRLVALVADYAEAHPEVDFLHFWLDDRMNATCECELCRNTRQSDFYVMLLNSIDRELTRRTLSTRIVSLIYHDLLWPPEKERLANPDRFVLLFCPISRLYDKPYEILSADIDLLPYHLNENKLPHDIQTNIAFLREWQKSGFMGMGAVYDYHMTWHHSYDMGYYGLTEVLAEDIRRLRDLGLNGYVSCALLRAFYPTGFPLYVHARLLWNPEYRTEDLAREYFVGAFGEEGTQVQEYMKALSDLSCYGTFYEIWRTKTLPSDTERAEVIQKLARIPDVVGKFRPVISRNETMGDTAHQLSWKLLSVHSGMVLRMTDVLRFRVEDRREEEDEAWKKLVDYLVLHEEDTDGVFCIGHFIVSVRRRH